MPAIMLRRKLASGLAPFWHGRRSLLLFRNVASVAIAVVACLVPEFGHAPGLCINPPPSTVTSAFVAEDPDLAWAQIGPHLLHDANAYAAWMTNSSSVTKSLARSVEELRAQEGAYRIFTPDEALAYIESNGLLLLQPLCGGLPPELAWESLETMKSRVLSRL